MRGHPPTCTLHFFLDSLLEQSIPSQVARCVILLGTYAPWDHLQRETQLPECSPRFLPTDCKLDKASGATIYNEALLGKALRDVGRENVVIATKVRPSTSPRPKRLLSKSPPLLSSFRPRRASPQSGITYDPKTFKGGVDGSPQFLKRSCAESLERLGVDSVDLFYLHRPDPKVPIEESVSALADLQRECADRGRHAGPTVRVACVCLTGLVVLCRGKVEHIGISNVTAEQIRRAHAVAPISAVQVRRCGDTDSPASSCCTQHALRWRLSLLCPAATAQMEWSLWSRGIEKEA